MRAAALLAWACRGGAAQAGVSVQPWGATRDGTAVQRVTLGTEGIGYAPYAAFAFETRHLPDSPNHAHFPSTVLRPGQRYRSVTTFRCSTTD